MQFKYRSSASALERFRTGEIETQNTAQLSAHVETANDASIVAVERARIKSGRLSAPKLPAE